MLPSFDQSSLLSFKAKCLQFAAGQFINNAFWQWAFLYPYMFRIFLKFAISFSRKPQLYHALELCLYYNKSFKIHLVKHVFQFGFFVIVIQVRFLQV